MNDEHVHDETQVPEDDLYLPRQRRFSRRWLLAGAAVALLLLAAAGAALALGLELFARPAGARPDPTRTPVQLAIPTITPTLPPAVASLSAWPQTSASAPVGMIEVILSLPAPARVSFQAPAGLRYWSGDLLPTDYGLAWTGSGETGPVELRWYLFREPGTTLPVELEVAIHDQVLAVTLRPGAPATTSTVLE